jgi:hypothetical protein
MKRWILVCVLIILLSACADNQLPVSTETPLHTQVIPTETTPPTETAAPLPTAAATFTPSPTPLPSPLTVSPRYRISAELDYGWKVVSARQEILIPHPSDQPISEIVLVVQPNWYPGTFQLDELSWLDGALIGDYALEGIRLRIPLAEPWVPGAAKELSIAFTLNLPTLDRGDEFGPNPFGYTSRQVNLTDWHPFVPPFIDGEWLVHNPWYYGEHLVYPVADYEVEFRLSNAPDGTVIAANALDRGEGNTHDYRIERVRNFVLSVSPDYRVFQQDVDGVKLLGYSFPYDAEIGEAAFDATVEAYQLYSQLFGPYPHESLSMIQADFLHGMEYDGLYFLSKAFYNTYDGTPATYLVAIAVHETAHQWWFGLVGNDQAQEPWLDEALCTYTELLYYENRHPEALAWWWDYRVEYYEPQGWVDLAIYDADSYRTYRDAVYLNGMKFLVKLRTLVGEDIFAAFLKDYLERNANELVKSADFFTILGDHTETDWSLLKAEYFRYP